MKRVDEVGQKRTGNNYWVVGSWGGGGPISWSFLRNP